MRYHKHLLERLVLLSLLIGSGAGCMPAGTGAPPPTAPTLKPVSPTSRPVSLISPVEFFTPEQKRLGEHLGWQVGCFKVEYAGPAATLGSRLELWTQGRPEPRGGSSTSSEPDKTEISISVQEAAGDSNYHVKLSQTGPAGGSSGSSGYTRPKLGSWSTRTAKIESPTELKPGEEIPVWALMLFKSGPGIEHSFKPGESIFDQVKRSDWALVLKVVVNPRTP